MPQAFRPSAPTAPAPRDMLETLFREGLETVDGARLLRTHSCFDGERWHYDAGAAGRSITFDIPREGRLIVVGAGKAAAALARGLEDVFGDRIDDGCIVVKYGHTEKLAHIGQYEAGHPVPDANGVEATGHILATLRELTPDDRVIVLLTGGASALLVDPIEGISLEDKAATTRLLLHSSASIDEINAVRKSLSSVKGGGLLRHLAPASSLTLLVSDVPNGDFGTIGSGPSIPEAGNGPDPIDIFRRHDLTDRLRPAVITALERSADRRRERGPDKGHHEVLLLAESADLVRNVSALARKQGLHTQIVESCMNGNTHEQAHRFVEAARRAVNEGERDLLLIAAGETTLEVSGQGTGGRNQEFALYAARLLDGLPGVTLLAAGTDGTDGPTEAAGGFADGASWSRARALGLDPAKALEDNDSHPLLAALGDLLVTGPSGTNLMDLVLALVGPDGSGRTTAP
ncbi:DUF4147 domain-containing protein [Novosphingobium sp. YJ-S2-02]|uniref:DUF4147 domain-containing protein n=1 Tax=Novosphingobium aureum TaxID=2792964 RepID=A0A931HDK9_9SPHN|nr:DUF4147 domain-containing protein [Novosphingobium aureum]MBH0113852.1 DUF4147 domain-containing protein [Novosphingobium aureum]